MVPQGEGAVVPPEGRRTVKGLGLWDSATKIEEIPHPIRDVVFLRWTLPRAKPLARSQFLHQCAHYDSLGAACGYGYAAQRAAYGEGTRLHFRHRRK